MAYLAAIPEPLIERQDALEAALRTHVKEAVKSDLPLYRMMEYQLGWIDRDGEPAVRPPAPRFHGALCLEAAASVGLSARGARGGQGESAGAAAAAAAAELMFQSVQVHEDMQSAEMRSDDHPAVWWTWGPAQAINVGDGLHALARLAVFSMGEHGDPPERVLAAVAALDGAALRYYEGQYMELTFQERIDVTEAQYLEMARAKHGSLVGVAAALGARAAGAEDDVADAFAAFGERLGVAAQIAADVAVIWGEAAPAGMVLNKSKIYPVVYALEHASVRQKRELGTIYFKRMMEPSDIEGVRRVLDQTGARAYAEARAAEEAAAAIAHLEGAGLGADALERWRTVAEALAPSASGPPASGDG